MNDYNLMWEAYLSEEEVEWHYTIVAVHGTHSELSSVLKSLGHVPDEKEKSMVKFFRKWAVDEGHVHRGDEDQNTGWFEDFSDYENDDTSDWPPEEREQWKKPGWNYMSTMYDSVGIPVAAGMYQISELVGIVKHPPPPKPIADGTKDWETDPDSRYGYRSTWAPKNWTSGEDEE